MGTARTMVMDAMGTARSMVMSIGNLKILHSMVISSVDCCNFKIIYKM